MVIPLVVDLGEVAVPGHVIAYVCMQEAGISKYPSTMIARNETPENSPIASHSREGSHLSASHACVQGVRDAVRLVQIAAIVISLRRLRAGGGPAGRRRRLRRRVDPWRGGGSGDLAGGVAHCCSWGKEETVLAMRFGARSV